MKLEAVGRIFQGYVKMCSLLSISGNFENISRAKHLQINEPIIIRQYIQYTLRIVHVGWRSVKEMFPF